MPSARSPLARRIVGLAAVPALLVGLAACGDDDDSAGGGGVCDDARSMDESLADVDVSDTSSAGFDDAIEAMSNLDPPAEIADDWNTMVESLQSLADVDISDPAAIEQLDQAQFADADEAFENVGTYLEEECGIEGAAG